MEYIRETTDFYIKEKTAITIGKFDGLHIGHQELIHKIVKKKSEHYKSVVFTFEMPPIDLLKNKQSEILLTNEERRFVFKHIGVDYVVEFPFTPEIAKLEPEEFVKTILVNKLNAGYIAIGTDFHFGYQRRGNYKLLTKLGEKYGFQVEVVEKLQYEGRDISSTFVKEEVKKGNIEKVNILLGHPFCIIGEVIHGKKIGRTLGMPTANLIPPDNKLLPPNGAYVSKTKFDEKWYEGITSIGYNPTVGGESQRRVETYLFGFEGDLYGKIIEVELYTFERAEIKFDSLEELKERLYKDMEFAKAYFQNPKLTAVDK